MDDPIFLQELQTAIYNEDQVKSIQQITNEYLGKQSNPRSISRSKKTNIEKDFADRLYSTRICDDEYGLPPMTLMVRPLMALYKGKQGRNFRRHIQHDLKSNPLLSQFPSLVTNALNKSVL